MSASPTISAAPAKPRLRLRLTPAAEYAVRTGHPWVYAERIREKTGKEIPVRLPSCTTARTGS